MFSNALESVTAFVRPIHTIGRSKSSRHITPGAGTLFFVNSDGWALTCRHVAEFILTSTQIKKNEETKINFINCCDGQMQLHIVLHPQFDLALLHFRNVRILCQKFARFAGPSSELKPGRMLCRVGFPFPEFTNYRLHPQTDELEWTNEGRLQTPIFPLEGMLTRFIAGVVNSKEEVFGFELSTPGLRGQSGGPVFDKDGLIWGVQSSTAHLHLGFDIEQEIIRDDKTVLIKDEAFLHVGRCVHLNVIKDFMKDNQVKFEEE